jgi:hypothetical protein
VVSNIAAIPPRVSDHLAALLRAEDVPWSSLNVTPAEFLEACAEDDLIGLIHLRLTTLQQANAWPPDVRDYLASHAHAEAAREILRRKEIVSVLDALAADGVYPILLKGTPLAYTLYEIPSSRPRTDTDLLVRRDEVDAVRRVMAALGYTAPIKCDGELLFSQFELRKEDEFGVNHTFDFHWKISIQSVFANVFAYDELAAGAVPIPALGPHARGAGLTEALLLACIHPVMHHRNVERPLWIYDIHLLASHLAESQFDRFADIAVTRSMAAIGARGLSLARAWFHTNVPESVTGTLMAAGIDEPSAAFLGADRRWHDELVSSIRGLPRWRDRLRLLREVILPSREYMLDTYGLGAGPLGAALLPVLYVHRGMRGVWKVLVGWK